MAGGSETWASSREIEGGLAPPSAEDDPEGVFGEGLVVDCVSRVGVLAMPADVAVGLNLQGTSEARQRAGEAGTWEFAPSAAELLRSYPRRAPRDRRRGRAFRAQRGRPRGARRVAISGGKVPPRRFPRRRRRRARVAGGRFPRRRSRWTRRTKRGEKNETNEREGGGAGRIAGGTSNARTRRLARRAAGEGPLRPPEATFAPRAGASPPRHSHKTARNRKNPASSPPSRILIPAEPPAVPAWNAASAAAGARRGEREHG